MNEKCALQLKNYEVILGYNQVTKLKKGIPIMTSKYQILACSLLLLSASLTSVSAVKTFPPIDPAEDIIGWRKTYKPAREVEEEMVTTSEFRPLPNGGYEIRPVFKTPRGRYEFHPVFKSKELEEIWANRACIRVHELKGSWEVQPEVTVTPELTNNRCMTDSSGIGYCSFDVTHDSAPFSNSAWYKTDRVSFWTNLTNCTYDATTNLFTYDATTNLFTYDATANLFTCD